ncbi:T9SS type A sorting domain-containing protein [Bacteroidota bacterium]
MKTMRFYILFVLLSFTISIFSNAQSIIYTDVNPDSTVVANVGEQAKFFLDIDHNFSNDFVVIHWLVSASWKAVALECYIDNEVMVSTGDLPKALNLNDVIAPNSSTWYNPSSPIYLNQTNGTTTVGNWQGVTDKYLGIRLKSTGEYFYGWIRLNVPAIPNSFTMKDYAYKTAAGVSLLAGDVTGIEEAEPDRYQIMVTPGSIIVEFNEPGVDQGVINILNINGQTMYTGTLNSVKTTISGLNLSQGIYFVYLYFNDKVHTTKFWYR